MRKAEALNWASLPANRWIQRMILSGLLLFGCGIAACGQWRKFDGRPVEPSPARSAAPAPAAGTTRTALPSGTLAHGFLTAHNQVRASVGLPALAWSEPLAAYAQKWADSLIQTGAFRHRSNSPYGENLFEITGGSTTPAEVVSDWASESRDYSYANNACTGVCGHYTQIIWRKTKSVGCAVARKGSREVWVCNYDPPGNYVGQRPY